MTTISEAAAVLAGFVLAHAVWSVSDLPNGDGFVPVAIVVVQGERQLRRFVADTPEEAVSKGRAELRAAMSNAEAWAFAHDAVTATVDQGTRPMRAMGVLLAPVMVIACGYCLATGQHDRLIAAHPSYHRGS